MQKMDMACEESFRQAVIELGGDEVSLESDFLFLPSKCHNQSSRLYHDDSHRKEIASPIGSRLAYRFGASDIVSVANSLKCLIGNYHDVIQVNVDGQLPACVVKVVDPYIIEQDGVYSIKEDLSVVSCKRIWAVLDIFGFEAGHVLSLRPSEGNIGGMNEFLSALVAMEELHAVGLPLKNIVRVVFGIATTIPFRGQTFFDNLLHRFETLHIGLTEEEIKLTAIVAVETDNNDVNDFREPDFISFIRGTWRLLPEYSKGLRSKDFPVSDYRIAMSKIMEFLRDQVDSNLIFNHAYGYPLKAEVDDMSCKAKRNIEMGVLYIQAKLLSVGVCEAVGSLAAPGKSLYVLIEGLQKMNYQTNREFGGVSQEVFSTLIDREDDMLFDSSKSPIAEYIFAHLSREEIVEASGLVEELFGSGNVVPQYRKFLQQLSVMLGEDIFDAIICALADVADSVGGDEGRKKRILGIPLILKAVAC